MTDVPRYHLFRGFTVDPKGETSHQFGIAMTADEARIRFEPFHYDKVIVWICGHQWVDLKTLERGA
jgi:hypothetical protein